MHVYDGGDTSEKRFSDGISITHTKTDRVTAFLMTVNKPIGMFGAQTHLIG